MTSTHLISTILLVIALPAIWVSPRLRASDDVYCVLAAFTGVICLIVGFVLAHCSLQRLMIVLLLTSLTYLHPPNNHSDY